MIFGIVCIILAFRKQIRGNEDERADLSDRIILYLSIAVSLVFCIFFLEATGTALLVFPLSLIYPFIIIGFNIKNLIILRGQYTAYNDISSIIIGGILWGLLLTVNMNLSNAYWDEPIYANYYHEEISSEYGGEVILLMFIGFVSLMILAFVTTTKLPPLLSAFLTSFTAIGLILFTILNIQLMKNADFYAKIMMFVYVLNLYLIAIRRIRLNIIGQVQKAEENQTQFRTKFGAGLHKLMSKVSSMTALSFGLMIPIIVVCEILYIINGQGPDGFIKAFTDTADWTFSKQTPPPPKEHEGHYLCTVAAGGHEKVVKPQRYGIRRGQKIIVNRQLLVANAFEDLIQERCPKFHRAVRNFYDKHGYPVSKHITTKSRADIVYILMKPLELLFITTLYLFDKDPENRIAVQYSDYKGRIG